jgi:hypothetical protein
MILPSSAGVNTLINMQTTKHSTLLRCAAAIAGGSGLTHIFCVCVDDCAFMSRRAAGGLQPFVNLNKAHPAAAAAAAAAAPAAQKPVACALDVGDSADALTVNNRCLMRTAHNIKRCMVTPKMYHQQTFQTCWSCMSYCL